MDISRCFRKKPPLLMRCTECNYEFVFSIGVLPFRGREIRLISKKNAADPVCPIKKQCHICHIGFMIPVNYTHKDGKRYLFHQIKPKIKNLDPNTIMERIFEDPDSEITIFSGFID